jgi:triosephosphate isomerase
MPSNRNKIVAANWKMNKTLPEAIQLVNEVLTLCDNNDILKIILPPFPFLNSVNEIIKQRSDFKLGAQNSHTKEQGAFTGEVSVGALKSVGCEFVLCGHSERRQLFREESHTIREKLDTILSAGLKPIFCVGEKLEDRQKGIHFNLIEAQVNEVLFHLNEERMKQVIIAYEPVWAIGTGETASPDQAQEIHGFIRDLIGGKFGNSVSKFIPILYGGSCNAKNARELFEEPDIDGGLIGGASLVASDFAAITRLFK